MIIYTCTSTNILQAVINDTSIDLWTIDENVLKTDICNLIYPPSFRVNVLGRKATKPFHLKICFKVSENSEEDFCMSLPLDQDMQGNVLHITILFVLLDSAGRVDNHESSCLGMVRYFNVH